MYESLIIGALTSSSTAVTWVLLRKNQVNNVIRVATVLLLLMVVAGFCFKFYGIRYFQLAVVSFLLCSAFALTKILKPHNGKDLDNRLHLIGFVVGFEISCWSILAFAAPGYLIPFLNHPYACLVLILLMLWQIVGVLILASRYWLKTPNQYYLSILLFTTIFALPVIMIPLLGPAVTTVYTGY